jgi:LysM repeat protein
MDEREEGSMEHFLELPEEAEEAEEAADDENTHQPSKSSDSRFQLMNIILCGVGVLIVILLIVTFWVRGDEATKEDVGQIQAMIGLIGERVKQLEGLEGRIAQLENQGKSLQESVAERDKSGNSVARRLDALNKRLDAMREIMISVEARSEAQLAAREKSGSQGEGRYHEVRSGETLYGIAKKYSLSVQELCQQNSISPNYSLKPGQRLLVASDSRQ